MATNRISSADAIRDFEIIQARIQAGETFAIEAKRGPVERGFATTPKARLMSEVIDGLRAKEDRMREVPVLDSEMAEAIEERIQSRKPSDQNRWA